MLPHIETAIERYLAELKAANETLYARISDLEQQHTEREASPSAEVSNQERRMRSRIQAQIQTAMNALDRLEAERAALESTLAKHVPDEEQRDTLLDIRHRERLSVVRTALEMARDALPAPVAPLATASAPTGADGGGDAAQPAVTVESRRAPQT